MQPAGRGRQGHRDASLRWSVSYGVVKVVDVDEVPVIINSNPIGGLACGLASAFLGWLELGVLGFKLLEEMPPPLLVIRMFQERDLLAVELLVIQAGTILESCDVNQPLEVANEFCADEELVCAVNFLLENFLERAGRAGNQVAHIGQLAEHEIVQCCEQLVELRGVGLLV